MQVTTEPEDAVVGFLSADGRLTIVECDSCPYRRMLCDVCIVPALRADPDIEENQFPLARGEA